MKHNPGYFNYWYNQIVLPYKMFSRDGFTTSLQIIESMYKPFQDRCIEVNGLIPLSEIIDLAVENNKAIDKNELLKSIDSFKAYKKRKKKDLLQRV